MNNLSNYGRTRESLKIKISLSGIIAFFLAISPILEPYSLFSIGSFFTIKLCDPFAVILAGICINKYGIVINNKTNQLIKIVAVIFIFTIFAAIVSDKNLNYLNSMKIILAWAIYAFLLAYIWKYPCREKMLIWVRYIAIFTTIVIFCQFVCGYAGIHFWDGRIPFLSLGKYDSWAGFVYEGFSDVRPCGVFQEPSYAGIYLIVAFADALLHNRVKTAVLFILGICATSSVLSILTSLIVFMYLAIINKNIRLSTKAGREIIFIIVIVLALSSFLYATNYSFRHTFDYVARRITNISSDLDSGARMGSTKIRLLGYIEYFNYYAFPQKLFGVGAGLFDDYFDLGTYYSNVYVASILDYGIIGLISLISVLAMFFIKALKNNRIFVLILLIVIGGDYNWFNWLFYFIFSMFIVKNKKE